MICPWTPEEDAKLRSGLSAVELAGMLPGRTAGAIKKRRRRIGAFRRDPDRIRREEPLIREMAAAGIPDREIAARLGYDRSTIHKRRVALGLESACRSGTAGFAEIRKRGTAEMARRYGWPADLCPRQVEILNLLAVNGPMTAREICEALGRGGDYPPRGDPRGADIPVLIRRAIVLDFGSVEERRQHLYMLAPGAIPKPQGGPES